MKRQLHAAEAETPMDNFMHIAEGWHAAEAKNSAGCSSSEEFLTRRSWKLVCFTQIPDVFAPTQSVQTLNSTSTYSPHFPGGGWPGAHLWGCWSQLLKTRSGVSLRAPGS